MAQELTAALTPIDVGKVLERHLPRDLGATAFTLGLLSRDGTRLEWVAGKGDPVGIGMDSFGRAPLEEPGIAAEAVQSARPVIASGARPGRCSPATT